jgi:hypothetical protein
MGVLMTDARDFRKANNFFLGDIANRYVAPERKKVMFAQRPHAHSCNDDHLVNTDAVERRFEFAGLVIYKLLPIASKSIGCFS